MKKKIETPILDKFRLHPFGGYCSCFSSPYSICRICQASEAQLQRWKNLSLEDKKLAEAEIDLAYPKTSNQDGR